MYSVETLTSTTYEIKKSLFIAYLTPLSAFDSLHVKLKNEHPKAAHIVWAKRWLNEYDQIVENNSDDGEPKGTSGPPVLNVMRGAELINVGLLIVRYFGGIKLGTGGLVRAYGTSAKEVISSSTLSEYIKKEWVNFHCTFNLMQRFEHFFSTNGWAFERVFDAQGAVWKSELSKVEREILLHFAQPYEREGFSLL